MNLREEEKKMNNEKDICMALKNMTLEEFASILNRYNEINANNNKKEEINEQTQTSKKILYTIDELIEEYPFFTRYNINKAIQNTGLPYLVIGNKKMFNKEEVEKWLDKESKSKKEKNKYEI